VGIFPGAGGTTRLTRMMGLMAAAPLLLEGKMLDPKAAKNAGLIDEVTAPADLLRAAKDWVLAAKDGDIVKPWDAKGYKFPGGGPYHPAGFMTFVGASAMVMGKTQGVYPAATAMLSAIYEGALVPFDVALRIEARWFTSVLMNPSSAAMIRSLFINKQALEKGASRPALPDQKVRRLGVIGAGMMGAGIAHVAAQAGIEVALIDRDQEAADRGRAHAEGLLAEGVKRRKLTEAAKAETLARITATPDYAALAGCDLVVEAVFEDPGVKAETTRRAERQLPRARSSPPTPPPCRSASWRRPAGRRRTSSGSTSSRPSTRWRWSRSSKGRGPATGLWPRRSISCARSRRRPSWSTTRGSSTPTAASFPTSTRACAWWPRASSPH
jgi:3-hydroxyacyl-CoA dehydrogenase/enoyl-CoA hydratase/3-hydroxybutyryl-CoA epimerase